MPESTQRAAFSKVPLRHIAASRSDRDNKHSQRSVALCRGVTARTVIEGQSPGINKLQITSLPDPLDFVSRGTCVMRPNSGIASQDEVIGSSRLWPITPRLHGKTLEELSMTRISSARRKRLQGIPLLYSGAHGPVTQQLGSCQTQAHGLWLGFTAQPQCQKGIL